MASLRHQPLLVVGTLVAAQGLAGELRILPRSDFPERFTQPGPRWLLARQGMPRAVELLGGRQLPGKSLFAVRLAGVSNRDAAEALIHQEFLVDAMSTQLAVIKDGYLVCEGDSREPMSNDDRGSVLHYLPQCGLDFTLC